MNRCSQICQGLRFDFCGGPHRAAAQKHTDAVFDGCLLLSADAADRSWRGGLSLTEICWKKVSPVTRLLFRETKRTKKRLCGNK